MKEHASQTSWEDLRKTLLDQSGSTQAIDRFDTIVARRRFLKQLGRAGMLAALGMFGAGADAARKGLFGRGFLPVAWAAERPGTFAKPDMLIHSEEPLNGEFPPHLLDASVTPTGRHFVRNNGLMPERARRSDAQGWTLTIDGEVRKALRLSLSDLEQFPSRSLKVVLECAGNGRAHFVPKVSGTPWDRGAVACSEWTGVRLRDVLKAAGLKPGANYLANYGEDPPHGAEPQFSRGIPLEKALDEHTLIAFKLNGRPLPPVHGFPARLIVPGWIGSSMQKWLNRIGVRDRVHDSEFMSGYSYRVPAHSIAPGSKPSENEMVVATSTLVKSLITSPKAETTFKAGEGWTARGHAWAGERKISKVMVSLDYGIHWTKARLTEPANKYAWYDWEVKLQLPRKGYYEIWARAFDNEGSAQPFVQPWNPKGYLGNVIHRVPIISV